MEFKDIEFGKASGETEGSRYPELLKKAYLDYKNIYQEIESGNNFLVLGHKGCGKSAIAEKLRLEAKEKRVSVIRLQEFPFKSFGKIFSGQAEPEAKYPTSWSWLLLLAIIDELRHDHGARDAVNIEYNKAIDKLDEFGLLSSSDLKSVAVKSSKKEFKIQIPKILEYSTAGSTQGNSYETIFTDLVSFLKELVINYSTEGGLILIIDGLDDILTSREVQYQALSALIFEAERLNLLFFSNKKKIHIVILCRTELYEKLPNPNKNKLRKDFGFELNWYQDTDYAEGSNLVKLVNLRAKLSFNKEIDIFKNFFPDTIKGKPSLQYLLEMTRHTPRDFISMMNCLKEIETNGKFTENLIMQGLKRYSIDYFEPEIRDEIVGYIDIHDYERFYEIISKIKQREFPYSKLKEISEVSKLTEDNLKKLMNVLYDCGAIGNKWSNGTSNRYEFKFRNKNSHFNSTYTVVLHKGLWKALNLI
ncbi:P-loop ATPase, Sll1717 family [Neisseria sp. 23W00296]|uniref:P-loop ATPase, Sll1717 family n=1 Tax=unclassified Neisseria TaxID=2623750 RepID=UPI00375642A3